VSYSEKFTADPVNEDQLAIGLRYIGTRAISDVRLTICLAELAAAPFELEHLRREL
jgi:hypothetical protein